VDTSPPSLRQRLVPRNFHDPTGLAWRLLQSREPAAYFAMVSTVLAALAVPFDRLLAGVERRRYAAAPAPTLPILVVVGAPRSGTTVVEQTLASHLPVTFFNNLTAIFPRAPLVANQLMGRWFDASPGSESFYGRTAGFGRPNDALHLWDRWLGTDRYALPDRLPPQAQEEMRRFFGAYQAVYGRPILNKNNALAPRVDLITDALPTAHILFVWRSPAFAVQSILGARRVIQGDPELPYGVGDPAYTPPPGRSPDYVEAVCAQVLFHDRRMREQEHALGPDRFTAVSYEGFCEAPHALVARVGRKVLGIEVDVDRLATALPPFRSRDRVRDVEEFARIEATLDRLRAAARPT
jgi:Sulfotransferase family